MQVHDPARVVGHDLDLDVPRADEQPLDVQRAVPEGRGRLAARLVDRLPQAVGGAHGAHAAPAAPRGRLQQKGIADPPGRGGETGVGLVGRGLAGDDGHARRLHQAPGLYLRAEARDDVGRGPDPRQAGVGARGGHLGGLGKEAVAGMDGVGAGLAGGVDDRADVEIAVARMRRTDGDGPIRRAHVRGPRVGGGAHRHRLDVELAARADDPQGDLAAIGHEQTGDGRGHRRHMRKTPNFGSAKGALRAIERPRARADLVSAAVITPSSHSRAVAYQGDPSWS